MEYRYGSHAVFQIEYHFVWVTKYRYKVLTGEDGVRLDASFSRRVSGLSVRNT
jgi:REP element-mobilizing transposase RayT